jgi:HlyD family secretion protein
MKSNFKNMNSKKIKIGVSILVALGVLFLGYKYFFSSATSEIRVETINAKKGEVITTVTATGTIAATTEVSVGTQVTGVIKKIYVDYNSVVKKGQLIAEIDKTNLNLAVAQAQAAYNGSMNEQRYLQSVFNRQKTLYENKVISKSDYDEALYNLNDAISSADEDKSDLQEAKTNLSYANIYSPIDGVVLSKEVDEGQTVTASYSTPTLFTIAKDLKEMQVEADVDEADIGQVKDGQRVSFTVDAYQDEVFSGIITQVRLNPTTTSNVVTYTVVIKAENQDLKLKPGLTATITIFTQELKDILTVEAKAVNFEPDFEVLKAYQLAHNFKITTDTKNKITEKGEAVVWILGNEGVSQKIIKTGISDGVNVEVKSGLIEGEKLVYALKTLTKTEAKNEEGSNDSPFIPKPPGKK